MLCNKKVRLGTLIIGRQFNNAISSNIFGETQQKENLTIVNPVSNFNNDSELESLLNLKEIVNSTEIPRMNNSSKEINLESLLNSSQNHHMKRKAKIRDSLPGIINKFGYNLNISVRLTSDRVRGKRKSPLDIGFIKSKELKEMY